MTPAIRVENLSKRYQLNHRATRTRYRTLRESLADWAAAPLRRWRSVARDRTEALWALNDVGFEVQPGEIVGVIGRNGAGKSTLLKILSRITKPTTGEVRLRGRVGCLLEVGTGFHPELTGRENIYLNGSILGMSRQEIDRKFDEIVEFAEVAKFVDTPVKRYSSGMYVRLAFAVAAHLEPEILIVDEVLAVGDAGFQKKCLGTMSGFARSGRTVILVSHNLATVEHLCNYAVVLDGGRLQFEGSAADAIRYYTRTRDLNAGDRLPSGRFGNRVLRAKTYSEEGDARDTFSVGDPLTVEVDLHLDHEITSPWLGVQIRTEFEQLVCHMANREQGVDLPALSGRRRVVCRVPSLPLLPGQYYINVILADYSNTRYDLAEHVCRFTVRPKPFPASGMPMTSEYGIVNIASRWGLS